MRFLLTLFLGFSTCYCFSGDCEGGCESSEMMTSKTRSAKYLEKIVVKFPMNVVVKQGNKNEYYIVGDAASVKELKAKIKNKSLIFETKALQMDPAHLGNITAYVTVKGLTTFTSEGRVALSIDHLITEILSMQCTGRTMIHAHLNCSGLRGNFSGYTDAHLVGEAHTQEITIVGEGVYNAAQLATSEMHLSMQGTAQAEVVATEAFYVDLSGNVTVTYSGKPQTIQKTVVGPAILKPSE